MLKKLNGNNVGLAIDLYKSKIPVKEILNKLVVGRKAFYNCLYRNNVQIEADQRRIIPINHDFFEEINTEEKAYFLGLMFADGCVPNHNKNKNKFRITLKVDDIAILERFKLALKFEGNIHIYNHKQYRKDWYKIQPKNRKPTGTLVVTSLPNRLALIKHGCVPNKSLILEWPKAVPDNLLHHFVRGYIDGDGWIIASKKYKRGIIGFVSSHCFCNTAKEVINKLLNINLSVCICKNTDKISTVGINGSNNFLKFTDWLYKDATVYLQRKYNKYIEAKNIILTNRTAYKEKLKTERIGEKNGRAFINTDTVLAIRNDYAEGVTLDELVIKYNLKRMHLIKITDRSIWKHV